MKVKSQTMQNIETYNLFMDNHGYGKPKIRIDQGTEYISPEKFKVS